MESSEIPATESDEPGIPETKALTQTITEAKKTWVDGAFLEPVHLFSRKVLGAVGRGKEIT